MQRLTAHLLAISLIIGLSGCSTQTSKTETTTRTTESGRTVGAAVPPSSPLAKIELGMSKKQVRDALGVASDENSYATGKAWIPWYFGNDARRTSWYYKGEGRVVFADGNIFGGGTPEVIRVDYDPAESGEAPNR